MIESKHERTYCLHHLFLRLPPRTPVGGRKAIAPLKSEWKEVTASNLDDIQLRTLWQIHSVIAINEIGFRQDGEDVKEIWRLNHSRVIVTSEELLQTRTNLEKSTGIKLALESWLARIRIGDMSKLTCGQGISEGLLKNYPLPRELALQIRQSEERIRLKDPNELWSNIEKLAQAQANPPPADATITPPKVAAD